MKAQKPQRATTRKKTHGGSSSSLVQRLNQGVFPEEIKFTQEILDVTPIHIEFVHPFIEKGYNSGLRLSRMFFSILEKVLKGYGKVDMFIPFNTSFMVVYDDGSPHWNRLPTVKELKPKKRRA